MPLVRFIETSASNTDMSTPPCLRVSLLGAANTRLPVDVRLGSGSSSFGVWGLGFRVQGYREDGGGWGGVVPRIWAESRSQQGPGKASNA